MKGPGLLILLLFALLCTHCDGGEEDLDTYQSYAYELAQTGYHYIDSDSTIGTVPGYSKISTVSDTDYIAIRNSILNRIELHPIQGDQVRYIPIDEAKYGSLVSFHVLSWDSIFIKVRGPRELHPSRDKELFLINAEGELIKSIDYADQIKLVGINADDVPEDAESIFNNQWDPIAYSKGHLVFGLLPAIRTYQPTKRSYSADYDFASNKVNYHPLHLDVYSANTVFVYQNPIKHVDVDQGKVLFGLRGTPTLQVMDLSQPGEAMQKTIPSDFLSLQHPPSVDTITQNGGFKSMSQLLSNYGEYGKILESTPDEMYLRFVYYAKQDSLFNATYGNGKTSGVNNRLCSIVLFDKNFQKQGESGTFEGLSDKNSGISKDGTLYVLDYNSDDLDENRIRYAKFRIQKVTIQQNES